MVPINTLQIFLMKGKEKLLLMNKFLYFFGILSLRLISYNVLSTKYFSENSLTTHAIPKSTLANSKSKSWEPSSISWVYLYSLEARYDSTYCLDFDLLSRNIKGNLDNSSYVIGFDINLLYFSPHTNISCISITPYI